MIFELDQAAGGGDGFSKLSIIQELLPQIEQQLVQLLELCLLAFIVIDFLDELPHILPLYLLEVGVDNVGKEEDLLDYLPRKFHVVDDENSLHFEVVARIHVV